jgi:UDP-N-acetylmuramoyl-tripeptide--D-alanyl-D-alanine ligase
VTIAALYEIYLQFSSIQTDTRKIEKDQLFFALKGDNFNGNLFAEKAIESGAAYAIVDENIATVKNEKIIVVENVLETLQQLAAYHRKQFNIPFIAITGSNGKTTTKELVHAVLSSQFKTYTTTGNLNNHIGIPLTILKVKKDAEIAVIEMGANHQKEIESYCVYTQPTHGIITNCGKAHLEGFGGEEGVRKGKGELFDFIRKNDGTIFAFSEYDYLHEMSNGISKTTWYGTQSGQVQGDLITAEPFLSVHISKPSAFDINTQLVGSYNLPNVLCAVAVGDHFEISADKIRSAIELYAPSNSRSQLIEKGSTRIILDAYNANPTSMRAAIENFSKIHADNKMLFLGGMMELGETSVKEHQQIVELIDQCKWKFVVLVGGDYKHVHHQYQYFENVLAAKEWMNTQSLDNSYLLIKGSRSMQMEKLLDK